MLSCLQTISQVRQEQLWHISLEAETHVSERGQSVRKTVRRCAEDSRVASSGQAASCNSIRVLDSNAELAVAYAELC